MVLSLDSLYFSSSKIKVALVVGTAATAISQSYHAQSHQVQLWHRS
jgi:hypothetical protein